MTEEQKNRRPIFIAIRASEAGRVLHDAARAQGHDSLSEFTRAAWLRMLKNPEQAQAEEPPNA